MAVQFIGAAFVSGKGEPNRFANKHLFIIDRGMSFIEMKNEAIQITRDRSNKKTVQHKSKFGNTPAPKNTVVITNSAVFEEMKDFVKKNLTFDNKHFAIPVSNGLVVTVEASSGNITDCNEGKPFYLIASARIDSNGVKDIYHFTGWSAGDPDRIIPWWMDTEDEQAQRQVGEGETIIPWWMELHDHSSPPELRQGAPNVVPR